MALYSYGPTWLWPRCCSKSIVEDLKWAACSTQHVAIYIANGHGAWEAALANIAEPGDKVLVAATGRFGLESSQRSHSTACGEASPNLEFVNLEFCYILFACREARCSLTTGYTR